MRSRLNDFIVPALTTRRAETTVELGSGQSFMIAGLLRNTNTNDINKAPFLGDLPILGALFRSTSFRRSETELVIIVTPYLVRPVSGQLALPTDGYRAPTDVQRVVGRPDFTGVIGPASGQPGSGSGPCTGAGAAARPLRGSSCDPPLLKERRCAPWSRNPCSPGSPRRSRAASTTPYDQPDRGLDAVNVPVVTRS